MQLLLHILHPTSGLLQRLLWIFSGRLVAEAFGAAAMRPMPAQAEQVWAKQPERPLQGRFGG